MNFRRLLALLLCLAVTVGCTLAATAETENAGEDPVLAYLNGEPIRESEVKGLFDYLIEMYSYYGYDMTTEENMSFARGVALNQVVQERLVMAYAKENGLDQFSAEDLAELDRQNGELWEDAIMQYVQTYGTEAEIANPDRLEELRQQAEAFYNKNGDTRETTLESLRQSMITERVQAALAAGAEVSEEDIAENFEARVAEDREYIPDPATYEFYTNYYGYEPTYIPAGFRKVQMLILEADETAMSDFIAVNAKWEEQVNALETDPATASDLDVPATETELEAARQAVLASVKGKLDEISARLAGGTSFEEVMAEYGAPGAEEEPAAADGLMISEDSIIHEPDLISAAFSLENVGDVSEPVVGSYGVCILCYLGDVPEGPVELSEELRTSIYEQLLEELETKIFNETVTVWVEGADLTFTEAGEAWRIPEIPEDATYEAEDE